MPIVVNGTTIPENVANVLNVNGTNITSVVCNGTTVWTQNLFNALWSGDSIEGAGSGIDTSGSTYRFRMNNTAYGATQSVNSSGIFSGNSYYSTTYGLGVSGNLIRTVMANVYSSTWVTFTLNTKAFSGSSSATFIDGDGNTSNYSLQTSGGLLRFFGINAGAYISLT